MFTTRPRPGADWWRTAVIYQVYLRSFHDSDGDGVGDLAGVRAKLPYLGALGVDGIWLNPFYPSPQHDHGYDVSDYFSVDPRYGTLDGFDHLVQDAHQHDIKVLIDLVPNHCSIEHPWFAAALAAGPGSPERERFHFADGRGEEPPNNWRSVFGGPAWQQVPDGQWYLHSFAPEQADFNWRHPDVAAYFEQVLRFWLERGVDGVRIDVAHGLHKAAGLPDHGQAIDDELTGDPLNPYAWNQPEVHDVWRRWRQIADGYSAFTGRERVLIGEVGVLDTRQLALYQRPDELHQTFYFEFLRAHWDAQILSDVVDRGLDTIQDAGSSVAWVLNNHDMPRSVTRYGGGAPGAHAGDLDLGTARARASVLLMLALPGAAYLYQGEELGLPEVTDLPDSVLTDPMFHRSNGARRGRDGCRIPLPWSAGQDAFGFSWSDPWLPQPDWFATHAVDHQLSRGESMLHLYREALGVRRRLPALASNDFDWLATEPGVLAFTRGDGFCCVVNCSSRVVAPPVDGELLLASHQEAGDKLPPNSAAWYLLSPSTPT
ncbi:glycoside hydrolase family 13 protein [Kribbella sp. NPDC049584]|uniref:glycoside hydrolase family 13 protein n=1 Tax=Kribbella sp. NPDC049584 TaxID=3154833 RepID=UPI00343B64A5